MASHKKNRLKSVEKSKGEFLASIFNTKLYEAAKISTGNE